MLLICPPLEAFDTAESTRAWLAELDRMAERYADDPQAQTDIAEERSFAERMLAAIEESA